MADIPRRGQFYLLFLGLLLGYIASSFIAAWYLPWYAESPVPNVMDCSKHVNWGVTRMIQWQVGGMFIFSVGLWIFATLVRRRRVKDEV